MELQLELGQLEYIGDTSDARVRDAVNIATQQALTDYFEDHKLNATVDQLEIGTDNPNQDGGATIVTIVVVAFVTGAATKLGEIAAEEIVAAIKRYLADEHSDKVKVHGDK